MIPVALYTGESSTSNACVSVPPIRILPGHLVFLPIPRFLDAVRSIKIEVTNATLVKVPFDLDHWQQVAAEDTRTACPSRTERPDPMAFQGPPEGLDRPAPSRRGPAARLPLAGPGAGRPRRPRRRRRHCSHPRRAGRSRPPPSGCASLADRLRLGMVRVAEHKLLTEAGASRERRSTTGSATASSSSTASGSTNGRSSGTSGTDARTASPAW